MQYKGKYASKVENIEDKESILEGRRLNTGYFRNHEKRYLI